MKNIFASLLVLALLAPAIGLLCHCCPDGAAKSSELSIQNSPCRCCSASEVKRDNARLGGNEGLVPLSLRIPMAQVPFADSGFLRPEFSSRDSGSQVFSPPLSSHTPLYLAEQVLRI